MRYITPGIACAGLVLLLSACGGGGGENPNPRPPPGANVAPTANAGPAQTVNAGVTVTLNGSASSDTDGTIATYAWTQTAGTPAITLSNATLAGPTFVAPTVVATTAFTFSLIVTDDDGAASTASTVIITVNVPAPNVAPTANAGAAQTVTSGMTVMLNGSASSDIDGTIASYAWTQTAGAPTVTLSNTSIAQPTFTAPTVATSTAFTFSLVVTDNSGAASAASTVTITLNPAPAGNVTVSGRITYGRVPFATTPPNGLNYGGVVQQPARGVVLRALPAGGGAALATTTTDASGDYSFSLPGNTSITLEVVAQLLRTGAAPTWNVRVANGAGAATYTHVDTAFNTSAGTRNVAIPTGINGSGTATGTRASGPFAALDTIYQGIQTIVGVAPTANFPTLLVDWGSQTAGTFFDSGNPQRIALLADLAADTDEFDQHVVAHEFGHYIEHNFSRADNIGGAHGVGDKLDPRVAFGEGFGYAFAAIVLNDPIARDSARQGGVLTSSSFNVETNPSTTPAGAVPSGNFGCWCSESSVWAILWDLYDSANDGNDTVSLGFAPMWAVLTGDQRTTPAYTTLFSFLTSLKIGRSAGELSAMNTLVTAQNVRFSDIDAFATTETFVPVPPFVQNIDVLPLYTNITVGGGPVVVRNVDDAGRGNALGARRFLRFTPATNGSITINLTSSNPSTPDPDFYLQRAGTYLLVEEDGPPQPETGSTNVVSGTTYVLDVFDCANGCIGDQGTPGNYDLTVTIN